MKRKITKRMARDRRNLLLTKRYKNALDNALSVWNTYTSTWSKYLRKSCGRVVASRCIK